MPSLTTHHRKEVVDYYNATRREYRVLWRSNRSLGIHFGYYDAEHQDHDAAVLNLNQKLADIVGITKKDRVLDAGCGIGGSTLWLAAYRGCRTTGVNVVPWQIKRAKSLAKQRHLDKLTDFRLADYANTGFTGETFTVVWGLESIVHAEDKQAVINEAFRLLKPDGKLMICEYLLTKEKLSPPDQTQLNQWLDGWAMPSLLSEKQYRALMSKAGFEKITAQDWTKQALPSFKRLERFINIFKPVAPLLCKLRIINKGQLGNINASDAQMKTLAKNLWRYKVMIAQKP